MTRMRRRTAALVVITLGLAACGSGDDDASGAAEDASTEESTEASTGEAAAAGVTDEDPDATADDGGSDEGGDDAVTADDPATGDDTGDGDVVVETDEGDDGGGDGPTIRSIDDVPERCRALMEDFLQQIEPVVEGVDWENATLADFEQIAADLEENATEFDTRSAEEECNDLNFEDDDGMELIIEFASDVAPGTVGFFRFLDNMMSSMPGAGDGTDDGGDGGGDAAGTIESCDDAIAFMEGLIAEYDGLTDVPISEITTFTNLGSVMMDCTPEQLAFFESPEVEAFLGG